MEKNLKIWNAMWKSDAINIKLMLFIFAITISVFFFYLNKLIPNVNDMQILAIISISWFSLYFVYKIVFRIDDSLDERVNAYLNFFLVTVVISTIYSFTNHAGLIIGLPFGHAGDFFQLIDLSIRNVYSEVSAIGYLPGVFTFSKALSFLFPTNNGALVINGISWTLYFSVQIFVLVIVYNRSMIYKPYNSSLFFMALFLSYPFLLNFERGNWVFLSLLFFSLVLDKNSKINPAFFGIFTSIKVLNGILLLPLMLMKPYEISRKLISIALFIVVIPSVILYFSNAELDYSKVFGNISGTNAFPDAHIAIAHSGFYSMLVFFQNLNLFTTLDRIYFIELCVFILGILFLIQVIFLLMQVFVFKKFEEVDAYLSLIYLFVIFKLFHHNNTDMNLILLIPIVLRLMCKKLAPLERVVLGFTMLLTINFNWFSLYSIQHDDQGRIFDYWFTIRTILYPSFMLFIMLAYWVYIVRNTKNYLLEKRHIMHKGL